MRFGLDETTIEKLSTVFEMNSKVDKALIFGSRAKGTYRDDSDIDIALKGYDISLNDVLQLSAALEDEGLAYKVDLVNYDSIKEPALVEHVDRVGVEIYSRWREVKLGEHISIINGYAFKSSEFLDVQIDGSLPVIKIKNVANGDVNLKDTQYHRFDKSLQKFLIKRGDILIALTGNHPEVMTQVVGQVSRVKIDTPAFINQRVAKILPKDSLNLDYLYYFLNYDATHDLIASQSSGTANQANISSKDIENLTVVIPPIVEQRIISSILSSLDNKIDLLHRQNKMLESLAETLFRQWFVEKAEDWEEQSLFDAVELVGGGTPKQTYRNTGMEGLNGYPEVI